MHGAVDAVIVLPMTKRTEKREYKAPALTNFGSIAKLTQGGGSADGGGGGLLGIGIEIDL